MDNTQKDSGRVFTVDVSELKSDIPSMYSNLVGTIKANRGAKKNLKKLKGYYRTELPSTIMGPNFDTAMDTIDSYLDAGQYGQARSYVKSQLQKLLKQTKGTGSEGYVETKLNKYRNIK